MSDAVYGDILSAFPELIKSYTVFNMKARAGGKGYGPRTNIRPVDGIFRRVPGGKLGIQADNRQSNAVASFWCFEEESSKIGQSAYLYMGGEGIYLMTKDNGYIAEAGYVKYLVAIVPGPTDLQVENPTVRTAFNDGFQ